MTHNSRFKILDSKFNILNSSEKGTTLIEVLIYITLLGFIMSASLVSVYQILNYSDTASAKTSVEQEAAFIISKIKWVLNDVDSITSPAANSSGSSLVIIKGGVQTTLTFSGNNITIQEGMVGTVLLLNSGRIAISGLNFQHIQQTGAMTVDTIKASFSANGKYFEVQRFVR
ncbi:MAG: hypothetical protein A3B91_02130 [Candidatus Yanofskybacteria bacterium RIFCSPHIGHO2_02_FULL_41_29]|uniref:Prepilin-type N-terminal cleavage/methylation domain-containing protein n=1 Tax=Candidatus Yanofskybacteria bacterium RIFCSPHIGHO2_01_FULL_41_53 TaxID=1802663 RepID=A0A1F8EG33_9BACT|nr:MAG: hypothetical protein A2650_04995 [Candidatus Yanofskybacteria bacterium RIFCSPHIGHO2_01_FULL_41_53]OGN12324.1 MAG: hypothetical protein A3B91_02130 [Candidatus Yanofskybacteria bacterium RIFCSPHIGHO2_02_FULL_41_29]OGN17717.1 MAG: hypothetical protein A3F48_00565 [Candidatus Yanofskybacteria bacterium RIFCSPHIGHO2_12_FULL_41_9]OGN22023.1 MAG: hypothetical protein A2916_04335 [Candidatus Yanofskybacteria bacterium RIFCSPLOWO2_01_FULL_41_67]OGN28913.1 MAG: hypothetical protein A3H54_02095 